MATVEDFLAKVGTAAGSLIDNVVLETDFTPRIVISQPLETSTTPPNPFVAAVLSRIRPRAVVNYTAASGLPPVIVAPYGTPTPLSEEQSDVAVVVLAGVGVLAIILVWRGLFYTRCPKPPDTPLPGLGAAYRAEQKRKKGKKHAKR